MVVVSPSKTKAWLAGMRVPGFRHHARNRLASLRLGEESGGKVRHLGILAFEAARTMSRLVSLHRVLSDDEVGRARAAMRERGVAYLNSTDQGALLRVACAEMVDGLDSAAAVVVRLGRRCGPGAWPHGFEHVYADLKAGVGDIARLGLGSHPRDVEKKVRKMERYVASTTALHGAMEGLAMLEDEERRRPAKWGTCDVLRKLIAQHRDLVRQLREESLWCRHFDKVAELMARSVVSIFARICSIYGPLVSELPPVAVGRHGRVEFVPRCRSRLCPQQHHPTGRASGLYSSGPLERTAVVGNVCSRKSGPLLRLPAREATDARSWKERALEPPPNTVGASGLALRYAKVVARVDALARSPGMVGEEAREELYWMLPLGLRGAVTAKLRGYRRMDDDEGRALASRWLEAVEGTLGWLLPMAHDTLRWHSQRSFEQRQMESAPGVLVLQTLVFSDKEKAEAAIVDLLVAFSCACRYWREGEREEDAWSADELGCFPFPRLRDEP